MYVCEWLFTVYRKTDILSPSSLGARSRIGQMFGILDLFRLDFSGFLEDFGGYFCRILEEVLICFSYSFGCFLGGF